MSNIYLGYGLRAGFDAIQTKDSDTLYFITDTQQIYRGNDLIADATKLNVAFVDSLPDAEFAESGKLYVVTDSQGTRIVAKQGDTLLPVGAGEATSVADGSIRFTSLANDVIATNFTNPSDDTIPTTAAVKAAIEEAIDTLDGAFVDVTPTVADGSTILTFTAQDGSTKDVTISDIFLTAASYDSDTHELVLQVKTAEGTDETRVDLSHLVSASFTDVNTGTETFTVELGTNGTLGGYKTGDVIGADTTLSQFVYKLTHKQVAPSYTAPTMTLSNNGGTPAGTYEYGTTITPKLLAKFNQNDAGALTGITLYANNVETDTAAASPAAFTVDAFTLSATQTYKASATHSEGAVKNDNLGDPYPTGHINAGTVQSAAFTYTPMRQGYFVGSTEDTETLTSDKVRTLTKAGHSYKAESVTYTVPAGAQRVIIACPVTGTGVTKVINTSALNADVTKTFNKSTLDIEGANGYEAITYNVWTFTPPQAYEQAATLTFTLS